jgi:hypothetical protein
MKFKTSEEYILNELYKTQEELYLANKKIKELQEKSNKDDTNEENMNCIYLSDKPNYWYSYSIQGTYNWNKILKDNKKTPDFVEKALSNDKSLKQLCKLKENDSWRSELGCINESVYNYLFKGRNGLYSVIETNKNSTYMYSISSNDKHFLTKEECENAFKEEMIKEINYYLKNYKDKFEEEK